MVEKDLLNSQEVADILKISRNTVYSLIKRGELKSIKVGKQVRIPKKEVEGYLYGSVVDNTEQKPLPTPVTHERKSIPGNAITGDKEFLRGDFIISGQDISLDLLTNRINNQDETLQIYRSYQGSYNGIFSLYHQRINMATAHMWDGDTDTYNVTYVKKMMPGIPVMIVRLIKRQQGFYVKIGNPQGIYDWHDLIRPGIRMVNREKGSGTRILLDEKLRLLGADGEGIEGYGRECKSHLAVANIVSQGGADVGIGCESGCMNIRGVNFIPIQTEAYDLVLWKQDSQKQPYQMILDILKSDSFRMDLQSINNYDTSETGEIIED